MSFNYGRMVKSLDSLSPNQLTTLRAEIDKRLSGQPKQPQSEPIKVLINVAQQDGYRKGVEATNYFWQEFKEPLYFEAQNMLMHTAYAIGIATAGFGKIPNVMLKDLGGKLSEAQTRYKFDVSRTENYTGAEYDRSGMKWIDKVLDALESAYSGGDGGEELRKLAAMVGGDLMAHNVIEIRPLVGPGHGKEKEKVIDRLCTRIEACLNEGRSVSFGDAYDLMVEDLAAIPNPTPDEIEEYTYTVSWTASAAEKAVRYRRSKIT